MGAKEGGEDRVVGVPMALGMIIISKVLFTPPCCSMARTNDVL